MLSPVSLLGSDMGMASAASKSSRPQEAFLPQRASRRSGSKAEQMIADVERLHEFGISLSLFPEDPLLRRSLKRMKERFQSLVVLGVSCGERDMSDGDCLDSDSDDDPGEDE
ncbi:hypothetical protein BDV96DRAFT_577475 [Lophiotrema nucula]|uniref:Uncharacterized protein n=1 Tax=Lophiotrema nucula TaxID=690887 RepID=A0A6A5Z4X3_9PLEO|nr:hypothetical protein BDV96DRAFT_577475 [Lophiotrema nucula]